MWMKLLAYRLVPDELIEVCFLSPATMGVMVEINVVKEAIAKHLNAQEVSISLSAASQTYFSGRVFDSLVACFVVTLVDGQKYEDTYSFLVVWE